MAKQARVPIIVKAPLVKVSAASVRLKAATARSSSKWASIVPVNSREPIGAPMPYSAAAPAAA